VKVLICGKGGSGKSTTVSLIAKNLTAKGYRVLVVDADESNYGLNQQLGLKEPKELMDQIGGKKALMGKMLFARNGGEKTPIFTEDMGIDDIPADCLSKNGDLYLLQIGKVKHFQEGCACPMGGLSKDFLKHLKLSSEDIALIDTEAGVEHIGRGVAGEVDLVLAVLDPSYESIKLSKKIAEMVKEAGKPVYFILNKVDAAIAEKMAADVGKEQVIATVPFTAAVQEKGLSGEPLDIVLPSIAGITDFIIMSQKANGAKRQ
jgi:CO dehydrogenase maturation factor